MLDGWVRIGNDFYWFTLQSQNFDEALAFCQGKDSWLLEPRDSEVFDIVISMAEDLGMDRVWLGLSDSLEEGT